MTSGLRKSSRPVTFAVTVVDSPERNISFGADRPTETLRTGAAVSIACSDMWMVERPMTSCGACATSFLGLSARTVEGWPPTSTFVVATSPSNGPRTVTGLPVCTTSGVSKI